MANIKVMDTIQEGVQLGLKNAPSLLGATILWILTIWIPYLNVGTTIAMCSIPVALSKGEILSPTFIFDAKYRKLMGDFLIWAGLSFIGTYVALLFMVIPGIVLKYSWSQSVYLLLDKHVNAIDALVYSNRLTYGLKKKLFLIDLVIGIAAGILMGILCSIAMKIGIVVFVIVYVAGLAAIVSIKLGVDSIVYQKLTSSSTAE